MGQTAQPTTGEDRFTPAGPRDPGDSSTVRLWARVRMDGSVELPNDLTLDEARRCIGYMARHAGALTEAMNEFYAALRRVSDVLCDPPPESFPEAADDRP